MQSCASDNIKFYSVLYMLLPDSEDSIVKCSQCSCWFQYTCMLDLKLALKSRVHCDETIVIYKPSLKRTTVPYTATYGIHLNVDDTRCLVVSECVVACVNYMHGVVQNRIDT